MVPHDYGTPKWFNWSWTSYVTWVYMSILPRSKIMPQPWLTYGASEKKGNTRRQCKFEVRSIVIIYIHVCDMYIIIYIYLQLYVACVFFQILCVYIYMICNYTNMHLYIYIWFVLAIYASWLQETGDTDLDSCLTLRDVLYIHTYLYPVPAYLSRRNLPLPPHQHAYVCMAQNGFTNRAKNLSNLWLCIDPSRIPILWVNRFKS